MSDAVAARRTVLVSAFLLSAIAVYRNRSAGDSFHALWGVGVVSMALSLLADFAPSIAGPFAALVVLGSLTEKGNNIIASALGKAAAQGSAPAPAASPRSAVAPAPANPSGPLHIPATH